MTPHVEIYIGAPIEYDSERLAFKAILAIVTAMNKDAIIIANVHVGQTQVDLIVAFEKNTHVIEVKKAYTPITGVSNGTWLQKTSTATWVPIRNYYDQAMKAGYAVKDKLSGFFGRKIHYPKAMVLFAPQLHPASQIPPTDFKVTTISLSMLTQFDNTPHPDGCSLQDWKKFIAAHNFQHVSIPAAAFSADLYQYEQLLATYYQSLISTYTDDIKNLVAVECEFDGGKIKPDDIPELIIANNNLIIAGPSGCAKTLIAKQTTVKLAQNNHVVVYLEAKYFGSLLGPLLDEEIKLLNVPSASQLFNACKKLEHSVTLIIDGYNECSSDKQKRIDRCLLALCNRYAANVIIVSQEKSAGSAALCLKPIDVPAPDLNIKKQIAGQSCSIEAVKILEPLLTTASSGLEALIIGAMGTYPVERKSKFALFDYYVRKKLGTQSTEGAKALSQIANYLSGRVSFVLSVRELERISEQLQISQATIDKLVKQKLLVQYFDKFSFGHELFLQASMAAGVINSTQQNEQAIISALALPVNYNSRIFLIGAIEDELILPNVLNNITDSQLIVSVYLGEAGEMATQWATTRYHSLLKKMEDETKQLQFSIVDDQIRKIAIDDNSLHKWSPLEFALIHAIPELLLRGFFVEEIFQMASRVDILLESEFARLLPEAKEKKIAIRSDLFASVYCPFMNEGCGLSRVVTDLHSGMVSLRIRNEYVPSKIKEFISIQSWSKGSLYVALTLGRFNDGIFPLFQIILECLTLKWKYLPYHLRQELLDSVRYFIDFDAERLQLINAVNSLPDSEDIFVRSSIFEALQALGGLESEETEHKDTVQQQLQAILSNKENPDYCSMAYGLFSAQFDHPYSAAYYSTIDSLNEVDKKDFLIMTVQGASDGIFTSIAILSLAKLGEPSVARHFERWRIAPPAESSHFPQDQLTIYLLCHIIEAQFEFSIDSRIGTFLTVRENALCAAAEICYWINRNDVIPPLKKQQCEPLWKYLEETARDLAVELVYQVIQSIRNHDIEFNLSFPVIRIQDIFQDRIAALCRIAILNPTQQKALYQWDKPSAIIHHAMAMLEAFGEQLDIPLLKSMANNAEFGTSAIRAIKRLEEKAL